MTFPYLLRLMCLCLASFFLAHLALCLLVRAVAPLAIRLGESLRPRHAARLLLALRLFPVAMAAFVVLALCVPSYLWLEPEASAERVGLACLVAALLGVGVWGMSLARVLRAAVSSLRYTRRCRREGHETRLAAAPFPVLVMEGEAPLMALAGVIRPRVVRALSPEQLQTALGHEWAHRTSRDNLKRLLLLLAPGVLPFSEGFAALDRSWKRFTEWAADDRAIEGDPRRSLSLASALVRVARMGAAARLSPLVTSLVAGDHDLSARVDRLLGSMPPREEPLGRMRVLLGGASLLMAVSLAALLLRPATLYSVHRLLEHLVR
jgi:Zn-dependent protease with chaperone function